MKINALFRHILLIFIVSIYSNLYPEQSYSNKVVSIHLLNEISFYDPINIFEPKIQLSIYFPFDFRFYIGTGLLIQNVYKNEIRCAEQLYFGIGYTFLRNSFISIEPSIYINLSSKWMEIYGISYSPKPDSDTVYWATHGWSYYFQYGSILKFILNTEPIKVFFAPGFKFLQYINTIPYLTIDIGLEYIF